MAMNNDSTSSVIVMTPGQRAGTGRRFAVVCTTAGNVEVVLTGGQTMILPVTIGFQSFPLQVAQVNNTGNTTAIGTFMNWL